MQKFIKYNIYFLLIIVCICYLINLLQTNYNPEPQHYKLQYKAALTNQNNFNGVILGSSHATHAIRPTYLNKTGLKFYNFALNGANPEYYFKWYNQIYLRLNQKPRYCLFAVDFFMFDYYWLWRKFEQDVAYFPLAVFCNELIFNPQISKKDLLTNRFAFLKYRTQITESFKLKKGDSDYDITEYDNGYVTYKVGFDSTKYVPKFDHKIDDELLVSFDKLIQQMLLDSVKIIFVTTPEFGIAETDYAKMESLNTIIKLANKYNIPYLNYNTTLRSNINKNINHFSDWGHMNSSGSKVFSKTLANDIIKYLNEDYGYNLQYRYNTKH